MLGAVHSDFYSKEQTSSVLLLIFVEYHFLVNFLQLSWSTKLNVRWSSISNILGIDRNIDHNFIYSWNSVFFPQKPKKFMPTDIDKTTVLCTCKFMPTDIYETTVLRSCICVLQYYHISTHFSLFQKFRDRRKKMNIRILMKPQYYNNCTCTCVLQCYLIQVGHTPDWHRHRGPHLGQHVCGGGQL